MRYDAIVIGAGLFGSIIAAELRAQGRSVLTIDDRRPEAGSRPAACLMKPSWFSGLGREVTDPSLALLDRLYGVHDLSFRVGPGHATVHWCDPARILVEEPMEARVIGVRRASSGGWAVGLGSAALVVPLVVVAAGVWTPDLVPVEGGLQGQAGMAFLWPREVMDGIEPFIRPWAPYRQLVAFDRGDGAWVGDGTAIKRENWTSDWEHVSYERCASAVGRLGLGDRERGVVRPMFGIRPYSKARPCYLREHQPGLWVATGGAKNGTIAAGWCAHEIARRTA